MSDIYIVNKIIRLLKGVIHPLTWYQANLGRIDLLLLSFIFFIFTSSMAPEPESPSSSSVSHAYHPTLSVTNVKALIPLVLDIDKVQYTPWATLFRNTAKAYNVLDHIDSSVKKPKDVDDDLWGRLDAIVCQWLYDTISTDLLLKILDDKSTAMTAWERLRNIFQDNKGTRVVHLENQFGNIHLSHFTSLGDYCQALKALSTQLAAIDHPISEERLVLELVGKLTTDYRMVATLIQQSSPLPSFDKACSMLELDCVSHEKNDSNSSSSDVVLMVGDEIPKSPSQPNLFIFLRGMLVLGLHLCFTLLVHIQAQQNWRPPSTQQQGILGPSPRISSSQPTQQAFLAPGSFQPNELPTFFNALPLQPPDSNWYMDTGATSDLMNNSGIDSSIVNWSN